MIPEFFLDLVTALGWQACLLAPLSILLGYVIFGMVGFGATLINVPLLAQFLPLRFVLPLTLALDLSAAVMVGSGFRGQADRAELRRMLPFVFLGMALGLALLINLPERVLLVLLGVFVLYAGISSLARRTNAAAIRTGWAMPAGIAGGIFSALYGTGGPIYTIYLSRRIADKTVFRATMATLILTVSLTRLAMFAISGLLLQDHLLLAALLLTPFVALGLALGNRLHHRLSGPRIMRMVFVLIVANGAALIARALQG